MRRRATGVSIGLSRLLVVCRRQRRAAPGDRAERRRRRPASRHVHHLAFDCDDLDATRARLEQAGIRYETHIVDELHQTQLFLSDPAGLGVELTFMQSD
ncbi:MAG: VOC family protein [Rhodanobacteraceae bacterium]